VNLVARYAVWYGRMAASPHGCNVFQCWSKYDFEYEDYVIEPPVGYIQGYYGSVVTDEDVARM